MALLYNFTRVGNLFFLAIGMIMLIDDKISPFYNWIVMFPLGVYTFIFLVKEGFFDISKGYHDHQVNHLYTKVD